jgi:ethanolamine utilization microcompartment shell protein EutL
MNVQSVWTAHISLWKYRSPPKGTNFPTEFVR